MEQNVRWLEIASAQYRDNNKPISITAVYPAPATGPDPGGSCTGYSCVPTNWWSAAALGGFLTGGVRPDERALKQRTRWTGVFSGFTGVSHFTCDLRWAAGAEKLTAMHNFTVVMS